MGLNLFKDWFVKMKSYIACDGNYFEKKLMTKAVLQNFRTTLCICYFNSMTT